MIERIYLSTERDGSLILVIFRVVTQASTITNVPTFTIALTAIGVAPRRPATFARSSLDATARLTIP